MDNYQGPDLKRTSQGCEAGFLTSTPRRSVLMLWVGRGMFTITYVPACHFFSRSECSLDHKEG
jgi:hypothetical protein